MGAFFIVFTVLQPGSANLGTVAGWLLVLFLGLQITEITRTIRKNRSGYSSFLNSEVMTDEAPVFRERFSTGIDRSSPIRGGLKGELMLLAACIVLIAISQRMTRSESEVWLLIYAMGHGILSLIQIALMAYRGPRMEELIVMQKGLLRLNREPGWFDKLPNEFLPWECITRVVASKSKGWWNKTLFVEVDRGASDRTIRFTKLGNEDWEQMLKAIGERTEVVREK